MPVRARFVLCLFVAAWVSAVAARPAAAEDVFFAVWNVENLFDDVKDGRHDEELMEWWNTRLYQKKLDRLASILSAMNDGKGPDLLALVEVENRKVLQDLVEKLPRPDGYRIAHHEGPSSRSIEVALISRIEVKASKSHFVLHALRDVLQVDLVKNGKPLTVLVNHWKSRFGGTLQTHDVRTICAARTFQIYYEIVRKRPDADVLICGDFNDGPDSVAVKEILAARRSRTKIERQTKRKSLYNCTTELTGDGRGTYFYDYDWEFLDQIVVSRDMLDTADDAGGWRYKAKSIRIHNPGGKLIRAGRPWRFGGEKTADVHRGYSDHLPLTAVLQVK